jgi:hypothetical protein
MPPRPEVAARPSELVLRAVRRVSIDALRAFRVSLAPLYAMATALLVSEAFYVAYSSLTMQAALDRTAHGIYGQGRAVGVILGSFIFPLPLALIGVATRAALARRYYGAQAARRPDPPKFLPLFFLELRVSLVIPVACVVGAMPGLVVMLVAATQDMLEIFPLGAVVAAVGAAAALAYVLPGVVFATRMVVLSGCSPQTALRENWAWAKGRRARIFALVCLGYASEVVSLAGLAVLVVAALLAMPFVRAFRDTLITQVYLDFAESDELLRRKASGVRAFVRW